MDEYKYVIKINFDNKLSMYYNGGNYCLVANPHNASRYKYNTTPKILEDVIYACSQGGEGSVILFDDACHEFYNKNKE